MEGCDAWDAQATGYLAKNLGNGCCYHSERGMMKLVDTLTSI